MNRTKGILIAAGLLALAAVILSRGTKSSTPPQVPTSPINQGNISLLANPSGSYLLHQGDGELYLDISLKAPDAKAAKRLPLNLGLVIDRSGSMAGQKLAHAREAATRLVNRLKDGDRIAIITYGSDVTLLVPSESITSESRDRILRAISSITDRGGTFLSGGLEQGKSEVLKHNREGFVNRVILISDGQANEGLTTTTALADLARQTLSSGVHLTTMGVGLDFNEEVMTAMAEHGGGHYYFIQNSSAMARFFGEELDTMTAIVGREATLKLTLEPGVELEQVFGYHFEQNGREVTVQLPDFFGGQSRKIICKFRIPTAREGKLSVAKVELLYGDPDTGKQLTVVSDAQVYVTKDREQVAEGKNEKVMARVEQVRAASTINEAMKAYARGDVDRSQAMLKAQIRHTRQAAVKLKSPALSNLVGEMDDQLEGTAAAAPSSARGRSLVKKSKFRAYKLAK